MRISHSDREQMKLDDESGRVEAGEEQCASVAKPYQCDRLAGHVGCHFAWMDDERKVNDRTYIECHGTIRWVDKGEKMKAAYPRKGCAVCAKRKAGAR